MRYVGRRPPASTRNSPSIPTLRAGRLATPGGSRRGLHNASVNEICWASAASVDSQFPVDPHASRGATGDAGWLAPLVLQHPFPVLNLHHHSGARIEPEMIGLAHIDRTIGNFQSFGLLQRFAQRAPELLGSRLRGLERLGNRVG